MKKETRKEIISHHDLGKLEKTYTYEYDDKKYSSLDEAINDHAKMESEKNIEAEKLTEANEIEKKRVVDLNESERKRIEDLNNNNLAKWLKSKPVLEVAIPTEPSLKWIDITKYEPKGELIKSVYTGEVSFNINDLNEEQLVELKLKLGIK